MTIQQISVFLENKSGRINEVTQILGDAGINLHAFSMSESAEFGILRLVVSDVERAAQVLREAHFAVILTPVVCILTPNTPGSLARIIARLTEQGIFIEYMYAFAQGDSARVVIRPTHMERCLEVLAQEDCRVLDDDKL